MIFVDSNIPMYLIGVAHPNKEAARRMIERCVENSERLVADAEVLQEILHRYTAIRRRDAIQPAFDLVFGIVDEVYPVAADNVRDAKALLAEHAGLSARDAIHVAIMRRYRIETIMSFDAAFDAVPHIERIER